MDMLDVYEAAVTKLDGENADGVTEAIQIVAGLFDGDGPALIAAWGTSFLALCSVAKLDPLEVVGVLAMAVGVAVVADA